MSRVPPPDLPDFRNALLNWYDQNRRDLPWRRTRDPYRIWISEIMLQQTRVAAVLEHYEVFLKRFPNLKSLAGASESAVLAVWSGLGYYLRARRMRECAQKIVGEYRGCFPQTAASLQLLPGIGRYTAAAIASIAFAEPIAVVDGNVERVLQRLAGTRLASEDLWQRAQSQLSSSRPGDSNQSMMELGAVVCTPRQPKCGACPVQEWCATKGDLPRISAKPSQSRKEVWCTLDERKGKVRLVQRCSKSSLMAAMWELPPYLVNDERDVPTHAGRIGALERSDTTPVRGSRLRGRSQSAPWQTFRHSITVTDYTVHVIRRFNARCNGNWIQIEKICDVPLTGLTRKILRAAGII